ncbi:MAG TPA: hypothetical protein VL403_12195, partial [Candidatus Kryptonia bacterium]|nr:hypothetical protein [Candidatus Kryptonia bacterium]
NQPVVFDAPQDQQVVAGQTLTLDFTARDPDGDPISYFAQVKDGTDVPPGSVITDHYDGTATFSWPTGPENVGTTVLRVAAFDEGGGEVFHDITLTVLPHAPAPCVGDCDGDGRVSVGELVAGVNIALGTASLDTCRAASTDGTSVAVSDLVAAVGHALNGCGQ